jgi:hypothetical protein
VAIALEQPLLDIHQVAASDARKLNLKKNYYTILNGNEINKINIDRRENNLNFCCTSQMKRF